MTGTSSAASLLSNLKKDRHQMTDEADVRRKRAIYRANHRGTKEMDVLVGRYTEAKIAGIPGEHLDRYERLLEMADRTLQSWIFEPALMGTSEFADFVLDIRQFHGLDGETGNKA